MWKSMLDVKGNHTVRYTVSLKQNHIFRRLYSKGKHTAAASLALYCRKNNLGHNRLGITVGVKVGHAVVRNRIRRRVKEAYRLNETTFLQGYDIVVVARVRAAYAKYQELEHSLLQMADKLNIVQREKEQ